jgi:broad specificity phosphatase PhoE
MKLLLLRHGLTDWNAEKRIQGRIDQPLSEAGIEQIQLRALPEVLRPITWYCSPMLRARQTAELLDIQSPILELALTEMNWGDWEGKILKPLRKQLGDVMRENEARGCDFCPPNGESPRQVQARLKPWLAEIGAQGEDCAAVVHKGIIRCLYALAFNWNMRGESPVKFDWTQLHEFEIDSDGHPRRQYRSVELISKS